MRHPILLSLALTGAMGLAACDDSGDAEVNRAMQDVNAIDGAGLSELMLSVADPNEAVSYFVRATGESPDRMDLQRGLGESLVRAGRPAEAVPVWTRVVASVEGTSEDRVELADALIRANDWDGAEAALDLIPPTHETYKRYRLEAMVADGNEEWSNADSFYETAAGLTTTPGGVFNNWGFSKLTRGDASGAEQLFVDALRADPGLFIAKNNLVLARGAQRNYDLPVIPMNQIERAQLLHTAALSAIKNNDVTIGRGLLREAIDTHPQHFEAASRALAALEANVAN